MNLVKINELRKRMIKHDVENDKAVVKLSARELQELLDFSEHALHHGVCDVWGCCRGGDDDAV